MKSSLLVLAALLAVVFGLSSSVMAQGGPGYYGGQPGTAPGNPMMQQMMMQQQMMQQQMMGQQMMGQQMMGQGGMPVAYAQQPPQAPPMEMSAAACGGACDDVLESCGGGCHKWFGFGEFLYLRAYNSEVAYAVPIRDAQSGPGFFDPVFQTGPVAVADLDGQPGYRVGFGKYLNDCTTLGVTYTEFAGNTNSSTTIGAPGESLRSLVSHPRAFNAASDFLDANAEYNIRFKTIDADYHTLFSQCDCYQLGYTVGARYAQLQQAFQANYFGNGSEFVRTKSNFYGAGLKLGLDGESYAFNRNLFAYGKTFLSLLAGENKATYLNDGPTNVGATRTAWKAGKIATVYDLEVGGGWQNACGNFRLSAGYMYSMWYNTVRTNEWINAVQRNNFTDPSGNFNGLTSFGGFVGRVEYRW